MKRDNDVSSFLEFVKLQKKKEGGIFCVIKNYFRDKRSAEMQFNMLRCF